MQDTNSLEELSSLFTTSSKSMNLLIHQINITKLPKIKSDVRTIFSRSTVIRLLMLIKLAGIPNVHRFMTLDFDALIPFGKDVLYKIKNSSIIPWRKIQLTHAYQCMNGIELNLTSKEKWQRPCFILDDSDITKTGKLTELIGRIFSHVSHKYPLGYKSLNLAYWSSHHLLHLDHCLQIELGKKGAQGLSKKELNNRHKKERKQGDAGLSRVLEASQSKIKNAIKMMRRAIAKGFKAQYILADSWFFCSAIIKFAIDKNMDLVSRPKFNSWKYTHEHKTYTIGELVKKLNRKKAKKWSKALQLYTMSATVVFKDYSLKIHFYKDKKRGSKWHALITTDLTLGSIQTFKIYQNRWAIEVSFKELKQHLGYGKCQSKNFDAQISDTTISLMAYNLLSHYKAINEYQSIGQLFAECSQDWLSPNLLKRFWAIFYKAICTIADLVKKDIQDLITCIMESNETIKKWQAVFDALTAET